jgi:polyisoprenoid-binding protein YceI
MLRTLFFLSLSTLFTMAALTPLDTYQIDSEGASVSFVIKNLGVEVDGTLDQPEGTIIFDADDLAASSIRASIKVKTIKTGIEARDESLREEEYFYVDKYPRMSFSSTGIAKSGTGYQATGKLTIKGQTKTINIPFTVENDVFKGGFTLDRLDFGVGESSWILSDEVKVKFSLPVNPG